ncbi:MAG: hypothetical protein RL194_1349 [Pseudomonadota bacterium]
MIAADLISNIAKKLGLDDAEIARRKSFLEFTDNDVALLREMHAQLQESSQGFASSFYQHLLSFPETAGLITDEAMLARLKQAQARHFSQLTEGGYDEHYIHQRLHVGVVHQRVGLDPKWYIGAYRKYLSFFFPLVAQTCEGDIEKFHASYDALLKIVMLDMELAIDTYIHADKTRIVQLEKSLRDLIEGVNAIVWEADPDTMHFSYVNAHAKTMLGYPRERWTNDPHFWESIIVDEDRASTVSYCIKQIKAGRDHELDYRVKTADGKVCWIHERVSVIVDEGGQTSSLRGLMVDITSLKESEEKLIHQATHDGLTGLPNRALLQDRIQQGIAHANRQGSTLALMFIDLDRFKIINDSLGHDVGDAVLQTAASRLTASVREVDTVARLGGDEFVMLLTDINRVEDITAIANKTLENLSKTFSIGRDEYVLTASIGISVYPKDGKDVQTLLKNADAAMYRAKADGKNRFEYFAEQMNVNAMRRMQIEHHLHTALEHGEFSLHYQPQADLESGRIVGVEALLRWNNPEIGAIPPDEFIPVAEETGLIVSIGKWVLQTACQQIAAWQDAGLPKLRVAVNISVRQFMQDDLVDVVTAALKTSGIDPVQLELELTESLLMDGNERVIGAMQALKDMGIGLSIDDFGTGYSSLGYLRRFPIRSVKIDRSFVHGINSDEDAAALVRSIISMAREMRLSVIAEGVETREQLSYLAHHGCHEIQGYFLGKPTSGEECVDVFSKFINLHQHFRADAHVQRTILLAGSGMGIDAHLRECLAGKEYRLLMAENEAEALDLLDRGPVGVVVCELDAAFASIDFMRQVRKLNPDTARILLAGCTSVEQSFETIFNEAIADKMLFKPLKGKQTWAVLSDAFNLYHSRLEQSGRVKGVVTKKP